MTNPARVGLLTGGSGFVGSRVAPWLAGRGWQVRALVRSRGDHPGLHAPGIEQVEGDFVEPAVAAAARGCTAVVHCAATVVADAATAERVNVAGTESLLAAARAAGVRRFEQISTIAIYALDGRSRIEEDAPLKQPDDPDVYGRTKAGADRAVLRAAASGLSAVILRPGAILGAHPTSAWGAVIPAMLRDGHVPPLVRLMPTLPWVHVDDVAAAVELALGSEGPRGRAWNLVTAAVPRREYVNEARSWCPGIPAVATADPGPGPGVVIATDRIRSDLGWQPRHTWAEGVAEMRAWWVAQAAG